MITSAGVLREAGSSRILDRLLLLLDEVLFRDFFIDFLQETVLQASGHRVHDSLHLRLRLGKLSSLGPR